MPRPVPSDGAPTPPTEIGQLSAVLSEDWLMKHKDKDVRLLVACGLADTLRIYAPDPP